MELPPLARGILGIRVGSERELGITPACAENTKSRHRHHYIPGNYPRFRGEYLCIFVAPPLNTELPPLARGIHCLTGNFRLTVGDIVELASKTCFFSIARYKRRFLDKHESIEINKLKFATMITLLSM